MDVRREDMARSVRQEGVAQPMDGTEPRLEVGITPTLTKPDVVLLGSGQPTPSPVVSTADAAEPPQWLIKYK